MNKSLALLFVVNLSSLGVFKAIFCSVGGLDSMFQFFSPIKGWSDD